MVIPISGFLPVPLPMMIPFMGAQSLVIGKMFGEGFQYGKRKISAMPNEEFNKLTFEKMMSNAREEIKASVPTMNAAMQDMKPMVDIVVREFLQYINEVSKTLQELTVTGVDELAHLVGGHIHGETEPTLQPQPIPTPTNPQLPFSPTNPTPFTPTTSTTSTTTHRHTAEHHLPQQAAIPLFRQRPIGIPSKIYVFRKRLTKGELDSMEQGHINMLAQMMALLKNPNTKPSNKRNIINFIPWVKMNLTEVQKAKIVYERTNAYA